MSPFTDWSDPHIEDRVPVGVQWVVDKHRKRIVEFLFQSSVAVEESPRIAADQTHETTEEAFYRLADEWSDETRTVSSVTALTSHRRYREIVNMGWDVVEYLLRDLQQNHRFWFPALYEITGIRPFDPSDAGNSKKMTEAWIKWGQKKHLI
jgi:hypothetical protein